MLGSYIKIGWRNISTRKLHSFINIFGLSLGIAIVLLIGGYVIGELNVNRNIKDVDRTYVVHSKWTPENAGVFYTTLGPLASELKDQFPLLVEDVYRYTIASSTVSASNGKIFREQLQIGDSSLISIFGFTLLHGNVNSVFRNEGIVVTEAMAQKYFGRSDVLGETLTLHTNDGIKVNHQITGVLKNMASNSVVNFTGSHTPNEIFLSMHTLRHFMPGADADWWFKYMVSIVKLAKGVVPSDLESPFKKIIASHAPDEYKSGLACELKPLRDYYLQWGDGKMLKMIRMLSAVAIFIVCLVAANFISIMVSSSSYRLREIGLRKLFGGVRHQLIGQFLTESIIISLMSMVLAMILYEISRPAFQELLGKPLVAIHEFEVYIFALILFFSVLTGCLAAIYPAIRLSSFKIVTAVKGKLPPLGEGRFIRKTLLCFQVTVAVFVLISSVIIAQQLAYIQNYDLGYNKESVLIITSVPREWNAQGISKMETVRTDFSNDNGVLNASVSYEVPDGNAGNRSNFRSVENKAVDMPLLNVDEHFASTFGIKVIAGNFFHNKQGIHAASRVVLNEQAVRNFGWTPESAIGRQITYDGNEQPLTVVGVVNNFHFSSLFQSMSPLSMIHINDKLSYRYLSLQINPEDKIATVERLKSKWASIFPSAPFDYMFMEDKINQFYAVEDRIYKSSKVASIITVSLTMSGMIAFMSISLARRIKEIGIRKVHGAASFDLIILLIKDFFWEFVIGGILASVLAYYFLTNWLNSFTYNVGLSPYAFASILLVILIVLSGFVVLYSLNIIRMNPVRSLRYE